MINWIKNHKVYTAAIVLFILAMVFNKPEDAKNAAAMFLFLGAIFLGFVGVIRQCDEDSRNYGV